MITKSEIQSLFHNWNQALQTCKTEEVLRCYADKAILLPTLSPIVRTNKKEIGDYFDFFLQLSPKARIKEENIRIFDDIAINSGIYVFTLTHKEKTSEVPVRFTFVYKRFNDTWLIVEHHSSAMPA